MKFIGAKTKDANSWMLRAIVNSFFQNFITIKASSNVVSKTKDKGGVRVIHLILMAIARLHNCIKIVIAWIRIISGIMWILFCWNLSHLKAHASIRISKIVGHDNIFLTIKNRTLAASNLNVSNKNSKFRFSST